eukprot:COSAG02_NODE_15416_length_1173_cov_1.227188_1_plen_391_part_11
MSRKAGTGFTLRDWELKRTQRLRAVLGSVYQWLLDLPAIPALVILVLTCVRAKPTVQELSDWRYPERANAKRRSNEPKEFAKLQLALKEANEELQGGTSVSGGRSSKLARIFDLDMSVELVHAQRRLSIGYMLHERLAEDSLTVDLPIEVVEQMAMAIAFNGRTIYHVPAIWPKGMSTLDQLLPLMPPDATVLLAPGMHRIHLELLRPNLELRGTGERAEDTMLVPFEYRSVGAHRRLIGNFGSDARSKSAPTLNNLTLMHEPTLPYDKYRVHPGEGNSEDQVQWRTLIWRQFALLALDLPWPFMAVLTGWRIWQLCREVNSKGLLYERWQRTVITLRYIGCTMLDIPVLVLWIAMACTAWRLPPLRRLHQNLANVTRHSRGAHTFVDLMV